MDWSVSGGSKSKKVQKEAAVDLGKYLHFAMADLQEVINTTKIESFFKLLADLGLGPSGQVAKLNVNSQAQTFADNIRMPDLSQKKEGMCRRQKPMD